MGNSIINEILLVREAAGHSDQSSDAKIRQVRSPAACRGPLHAGGVLPSARGSNPGLTASTLHDLGLSPTSHPSVSSAIKWGPNFSDGVTACEVPAMGT